MSPTQPVSPLRPGPRGLTINHLVENNMLKFVTLLVLLAQDQYAESLHVVQLEVLYLLTGDDVFRRFAERWDGYAKRWLNRKRGRKS